MPKPQADMALRVTVGKPEVWTAALKTPLAALTPPSRSTEAVPTPSPSVVSQPKAPQPAASPPQPAKAWLGEFRHLIQEARLDDADDRLRQPNLRQRDIDLLFGRKP